MAFSPKLEFWFQKVISYLLIAPKIFKISKFEIFENFWAKISEVFQRPLEANFGHFGKMVKIEPWPFGPRLGTKRREGALGVQVQASPWSRSPDSLDLGLRPPAGPYRRKEGS